MRLEKGMLIKTNYSEQAYRIVEIERGCTCPTYINKLDMDDPPAQPPHLHLTLTRPDGSGKFWISHFIEETLCSLEKTYCGFKKEPDVDHIIILGQDRLVQQTLF